MPEVNVAYKFCCPLCAVAQYDPKPVPLIMACCFGCFYTMFCWKPEEAGKPGQQEMTEPKQQEMK